MHHPSTFHSICGDDTENPRPRENNTGARFFRASFQSNVKTQPASERTRALVCMILFGLLYQINNRRCWNAEWYVKRAVKRPLLRPRAREMQLCATSAHQHTLRGNCGERLPAHQYQSARQRLGEMLVRVMQKKHTATLDVCVCVCVCVCESKMVWVWMRSVAVEGATEKALFFPVPARLGGNDPAQQRAGCAGSI